MVDSFPTFKYVKRPPKVDQKISKENTTELLAQDQSFVQPTFGTADVLEF